MIRALCRLDQTPALVSDVIRERGQQEKNPKHFSTTFQQSNYPTGTSESRWFSYYQQDADKSDDDFEAAAQPDVVPTWDDRDDGRCPT